MRLRFLTPLLAGCVLAAAKLGLARAGYSLAAATAADVVPPIILEDFEGSTLGQRPYLWKDLKETGTMESTVGAEKASVEGNEANKALKFEYTFSSTYDATHGVETGPREQALPGSLVAVSMMVNGDKSGNAIGLRLRDRLGETFMWEIPVTWSGWQKVRYALNPATAIRGGTRQNGVFDLPLAFDAVRLQRTPAGKRKGELMVDDLIAECSFGKVTTLFDVAKGFKPADWRAVRNRAVGGEAAETLRPRGGKDVSVLDFLYKYENSGDASVEFARTITAGDTNGTLIAEVFGDGSNNILRFRMLDGTDHTWQANWACILVDWSGWRTLYLDTRTLKDTEGTDPTAMITKFPVKFQSLIVDDVSPKDLLPGVESGREGDVALGRLLFCSEK